MDQEVVMTFVPLQLRTAVQSVMSDPVLSWMDSWDWNLEVTYKRLVVEAISFGIFENCLEEVAIVHSCAVRA